MCLIVLCFLSLCYMCIYLFDCYSMYMLFANKEFIQIHFTLEYTESLPTLKTVGLNVMTFVFIATIR